jgi:hypothetical protein
MYCEYCGRKMIESSRFCGFCGKRQKPVPGASAEIGQQDADNQEELLFYFGPFGIMLCDGHYSMWKWQRNNSVIIEMTDSRICAVPNQSFGLLTVPAHNWTPGVKLPFEIPYGSIDSVEVYSHPAGLGMMDVLGIKYHVGEEACEKSIASFRNNIAQAWRVLAGVRPDLAAAQK